MAVAEPMALVRKAPQMLEVCAHQLWTGDMVEETRCVLYLGYTKSVDVRGTINATFVSVARDEPAGVGRDYERREVEWCERFKVVRGMPLPTGSYLTQFDIWGHCHGHKYPPGSQKPCDCEWHD